MAKTTSHIYIPFYFYYVHFCETVSAYYNKHRAKKINHHCFGAENHTHGISIEQLMYFLTERLWQCQRSPINQRKAGERNLPVMCRSTEFSRQNIKQLMYSLSSLRKVMAFSALSNQPMISQNSTNHVQQQRIPPPKYQTADVLSDLFEEGDGKSQRSLINE